MFYEFISVHVLVDRTKTSNDDGDDVDDDDDDGGITGAVVIGWIRSTVLVFRISLGVIGLFVWFERRQ